MLTISENDSADISSIEDGDAQSAEHAVTGDSDVTTQEEAVITEPTMPPPTRSSTPEEGECTETEAVASSASPAQLSTPRPSLPPSPSFPLKPNRRPSTSQRRPQALAPVSAHEGRCRNGHVACSEECAGWNVQPRLIPVRPDWDRPYEGPRYDSTERWCHDRYRLVYGERSISYDD